MNKTSTKTLITLAVVLISFIFIVEFTSPIQSINIGHLQKRQDPPPPPKENPPPPPKENPPPPPKENPPPPPKENPPPPPKENPPPPPKENPPQESPPPPKENPPPEPQPTPETPTSNPSEPPPSPNPPAPNPSPPQTTDPNAPQTSSSPNPPAPNPNPPQTSDPNAPTPNPATSGLSSSSSPNPGVSSVSPTAPKSKSYPPGQEPCTKADDPRCGRGPTDPTVVSTTEENEIITEPSITPAGPTKSQSQLAPNPKKSTITQFTTYTTTETLYFPGYSTVTSSKGPNGELTTYATYIPPSTVVVVKKVTSAKIEEIQETNPSSAGHLDLELSVYNLYSVATSLFVISVTMLYLIVA